MVAEQADMKSDIKQMKGDIQGLKLDVQDLRGRFTLLQWMVGFNLAATMAVLWKLIR